MVLKVRTTPLYGYETWPAEALDKLLSGMMGSHGQIHVPSADVVESRDGYTIDVEMPGVKKEDVRLGVENGLLSIEAKRASDLREERKMVRNERWTGDVRRSFRIPDDVDAGRISASLENGVLSLDLPRHERALPREIRIR